MYSHRSAVARCTSASGELSLAMNVGDVHHERSSIIVLPKLGWCGGCNGTLCAVAAPQEVVHAARWRGGLEVDRHPRPSEKGLFAPSSAEVEAARKGRPRQ